MRRKQLKVVNDVNEIPQFTSEAEEHDFWSTHEMGDALWQNAEPLAPDELPPPRPRPDTRAVVIRLDEPTLARARELAKRRHRRVESVLAELVTKQLAAFGG